MNIKINVKERLIMDDLYKLSDHFIYLTILSLIKCLFLFSFSCVQAKRVHEIFLILENRHIS